MVVPYYSLLVPITPLELALIAACAAVGPLRAALAALGPAQRVCFGLQQAVERLLDRTAHQRTWMRRSSICTTLPNVFLLSPVMVVVSSVGR